MTAILDLVISLLLLQQKLYSKTNLRFQRVPEAILHRRLSQQAQAHPPFRAESTDPAENRRGQQETLERVRRRRIHYSREQLYAYRRGRIK